MDDVEKLTYMFIGYYNKLVHRKKWLEQYIEKVDKDDRDSVLYSKLKRRLRIIDYDIEKFLLFYNPLYYMDIVKEEKKFSLNYI